MLVALAVALPFLLLTAGIVWKLAENERENRREAILYSTRTLVNAVDALLGKQIAIGQHPGGLARRCRPTTSPNSATRPSALAWHCPAAGSCLADEDGQQLVNLARPAEPMPLPQRKSLRANCSARARKPARVQISDVIHRRVSRRRRSSPSTCRSFAPASRRSASP